MTLALHMETLENTAAALQNLQFSHTQAFVNALLTDRDITTLIRDAEPHEQALFSCPPSGAKSSQAVGMHGNSMMLRTGPTPMRLQLRKETAQLLQRSRASQAQEGDRVAEEASLGALLVCIEKLLVLYPEPGEQAQVDLLRHKHTQLQDSIAHLEAEAERQRLELKSKNLAMGQGYALQEERGSSAGEEHITEEMIRQAEEEIRKMEEQVQGRATGP